MGGAAGVVRHDAGLAGHAEQTAQGWGPTHFVKNVELLGVERFWASRGWIVVVAQIPTGSTVIRDLTEIGVAWAQGDSRARVDALGNAPFLVSGGQTTALAWSIARDRFRNDTFGLDLGDGRGSVDQRIRNTKRPILSDQGFAYGLQRVRNALGVADAVDASVIAEPIDEFLDA